jgi:hypothetical protein
MACFICPAVEAKRCGGSIANMRRRDLHRYRELCRSGTHNAIARSSVASSSPRSWPSEIGSGPGTSANRTSSTDRSSKHSMRSRRSSPSRSQDSDASPAGCDAAPIASPACHTSSTPLNNSGSARAVRSELRQTWHGVAHFNPDARASRLTSSVRFRIRSPAPIASLCAPHAGWGSLVSGSAPGSRPASLRADSCA